LGVFRRHIVIAIIILVFTIFTIYGHPSSYYKLHGLHKISLKAILRYIILLAISSANQASCILSSSRVDAYSCILSP
jgi:hypothetical protein